jgi:hypothetical protein
MTGEMLARTDTAVHNLGMPPPLTLLLMLFVAFTAWGRAALQKNTASLSLCASNYPRMKSKAHRSKVLLHP